MELKESHYYVCEREVAKDIFKGCGLMMRTTLTLYESNLPEQT